MFEKEIKFIGDFCLNQVRNLGPVFTFQKISQTNLHPAIICYVSAELDFMIYADRQKLLQQSYFDYSGKEISNHFQKISGEIKKNKKISSDDLKKLILQAVSFNANYLVRPRWSLTKLIFNEQPLISVEELQMMLNYLYYYEYFRKVLSAYLSKRKLIQISRTEFDLILNKIDTELFSSSQEQLVENALISLGDFFNIGGVEKNFVSTTAIEIFLKEKNMLDLVFKLRKEVPEGVKKRYDKSDLKRILFATGIVQKTEDITITDSEIVIDGHGNTNEDPGEPNLDALADKYADELDKIESESFLSPEEEETLLSLYDDELNEVTFDSEIESTETESAETDLSEESKKDFYNESENNSILTEDELQLADGDRWDISDERNTEAENKFEPEKEQDEIKIEEDSFKKEIVQEMIRDFVGEQQNEQDVDENTQTKLEAQSIPDLEEPIIDSLENELLNIFDDVDKFNAGSSSEEITIEEINDTSSKSETIESDLSSPFLKEDGLDEYLKNIDELIVPKEKNNAGEEMDKQVIEETPEIRTRPENVAPVEVPEEKSKTEKQKNYRHVRQKDLFSYLKRKEIKKIVSFIFANDEEDFTNTVERIMDCHSYKDASEILKAVFTSYKISPYSKEAITFTNAVSNYFRQA